MSTPVLAAIILIAICCPAFLARRRLADRRSLAAHHRTVESMGRLVARQPLGDTPPPREQHPGQAHVRLGADGDPASARPPLVPGLPSRRRV